jgi:hypothetical protein
MGSFLGLPHLWPPLATPPPRPSPYSAIGSCHKLRDFFLSLFSLAGIMFCLGNPPRSGTEAHGVAFLGQEVFVLVVSLQNLAEISPSSTFFTGRFFCLDFFAYLRNEKVVQPGRTCTGPHFFSEEGLTFCRSVFLPQT